MDTHRYMHLFFCQGPRLYISTIILISSPFVLWIHHAAYESRLALLPCGPCLTLPTCCHSFFFISFGSLLPTSLLDPLTMSSSQSYSSLLRFILNVVSLASTQTIWIQFAPVSPALNSTDDFLISFILGSNKQVVKLSPSFGQSVTSAKACTQSGEKSPTDQCALYRGGLFKLQESACEALNHTPKLKTKPETSIS
jgi:hypothetical protein